MKRKYWTVKVPRPKADDIVFLFQSIFVLMIGASVFGALVMALCLMIEIFFKVKLI